MLGPKYDPFKPEKYVSTMTVTQLYLPMGRAMEPIDEVKAGNIFALGGIKNHVIKTATLTTSLACVSFDNMNRGAAPIVRVAVETVNSVDAPKLREVSESFEPVLKAQGMKMLNLADPGCEVYIQKTGEYIVAASGELHLNHCLNVLRQEFAKIEIKVSEPLVSFKETITEDLVREVKKDEDGVEDEDEYDYDGTISEEDEEPKKEETDKAELDREWMRQIVAKGKKYGIDVVGKSTGDRSTVFYVRALPIPELVFFFSKAHVN